ncbi:hypothetical protein B296_00024748 [Ensete ventricosum]|uniref:Uncharacterized protein n=1 Tax=Ensete ventricosum TaxID=4639 RepID=A0A427A2G2_ENSVE|nr:hypothetical protein B296_00024748 [Ensete ventricosum]
MGRGEGKGVPSCWYQRDSSARFLLSSPAAQPALTTEESSTAPDSRLTLLDEDDEAVAALSFTDLDAWSRIPCAALAPPCTTTRLMYRKLIQRTHHRHTPAHTVHPVIGNDGPSAYGFRRMTAGTKDSEVRVACSRGTCGRIPRSEFADRTRVGCLGFRILLIFTSVRRRGIQEATEYFLEKPVDFSGNGEKPFAPPSPPAETRAP